MNVSTSWNIIISTLSTNAHTEILNDSTFFSLKFRLFTINKIIFFPIATNFTFFIQV